MDTRLALLAKDGVQETRKFRINRLLTGTAIIAKN